jgi:hypothetical protein
MSEDPKGFDAGDCNLFRYCNNDPEDHTDPMGLEEQYHQQLRILRHDDGLTIDERRSAWQMATENTIRGENIARGLELSGLTRQAERFLTQYYRRYEQQLNAKIAKLFGAMGALVPYQNINNAPNVVMGLSKKQVYEIGQLITKGSSQTGNKVPEASGFSTMPDDIRGRGFLGDEGGQGTIFIASDSASSKERIYTHELGNVLSNRLTGNPNTFGNPRYMETKYRDPDTGDNLETAMFGPRP